MTSSSVENKETQTRASKNPKRDLNYRFKMALIYKYCLKENPTKCYVGNTKSDDPNITPEKALSNRDKKHIYDGNSREKIRTKVTDGKKLKDWEKKTISKGNPIDDAINKYGRDAFNLEILKVKNNISVQEIKKLETNYINKENSLVSDGGYNINLPTESYPVTKQTKEILSDNSKEIGKSQEYRDLQSERSKANWEKKEYRDKLTQIITERANDPKYKEIVSNFMKEQWQDKEYVESVMKSRAETYATQEFKDMKSEIQKYVWNRPGQREKVGNSIREAHAANNFGEKMREISTERWKKEGFKDMMIEIQTEVWSNQELRDQRAEITKELWNNDEFREKTLKNQKEVTSSKEFRENMSKVQKEVGQRPEVKQIRSENTTKLWGDKEYVDKVNNNRNAVMETEEYSKSISEANKRRFAKPEEREKQSVSSKKAWQKVERIEKDALRHYHDIYSKVDLQAFHEDVKKGKFALEIQKQHGIGEKAQIKLYQQLYGTKSKAEAIKTANSLSDKEIDTRIKAYHAKFADLGQKYGEDKGKGKKTIYPTSKENINGKQEKSDSKEGKNSHDFSKDKKKIGKNNPHIEKRHLDSKEKNKVSNKEAIYGKKSNDKKRDLGKPTQKTTGSKESSNTSKIYGNESNETKNDAGKPNQKSKDVTKSKRSNSESGKRNIENIIVPTYVGVNWELQKIPPNTYKNHNYNSRGYVLLGKFIKGNK